MAALIVSAIVTTMSFLEPHVKAVVSYEASGSNFVNIKWNFPDPAEWRGPIAGHKIYLSKNKTCGRTKRLMEFSVNYFCSGKTYDANETHDRFQMGVVFKTFP